MTAALEGPFWERTFMVKNEVGINRDKPKIERKFLREKIRKEQKSTRSINVT
jgi:hypothetical protein